MDKPDSLLVEARAIALSLTTYEEVHAPAFAEGNYDNWSSVRAAYIALQRHANPTPAQRWHNAGTRRYKQEYRGSARAR